MKLFLLKRKSQKIVLFLSFVILGMISDMLHGADAIDHYYPKIEKTLQTCLCDKTNKNSFQYFVNHLIEILIQYTAFLENHQHRSHIEEQNGGLTTVVIQGFKNDLEKIRYSNNLLQIGVILAKYKRFLPGSMKAMTVQQLAIGLKYRLSQRENNTQELIAIP